MKTTTKQTDKKNPHDEANEALDAMMTESEKRWWKEVEKDELEKAGR